MLKRLKRKSSCGLKCRSGLAATEFALLLPLMVTLFFGLIEASDAMMMNRRVALATSTLADLVAQTEQITPTQLDSLLVGVMEILEPDDTSAVSLNLISVTADADGDPVVAWSRDKDGNEPYAAGDDYTALSEPDILTQWSNIVVVEMSFPYQPTITGHVLSSPITFQRQSIRWPRLNTGVILCDPPSSCPSS